jgi:pilus assembly protein Flp/PilA
MLKYYIKTNEALKQLRTDTAGVVSFEYLIVAACVVAAVLFAFGPTGDGTLGQALAGAISTITGKMSVAVNGA